MAVATWGGSNIAPFGVQPLSNGSSNIVLPYTFVPGTTADANQVNADFQALANWVNQNGAVIINGPLTFYVGPGGTDANNTGLNSNQPAATVGHVYDVLRSSFRYGSWANNLTVTIQLQPGTYNETISISGVIPGQSSNAWLWIQGAQSNPGSVIINGDPAIVANDHSMVTVAGVTLTSPNHHGLSAVHSSLLAFTNCNFGNCGLGQLYANRGGMVIAGGNYSISGSALVHAFANEGGNCTLQIGNVNDTAVNPGPQVTINGNPNFSVGFAAAQDTGLVYLRNVGFINPQNVTGPRHYATAGGVVDTGGATLPGNLPGSIDNGGIYKGP